MARTFFFWDPDEDNIVQERDESGAITAEYTTEPRLYGNLVSQDRDGVESQYHFDPQGSTLALTDDNQQVTDAYAYDAFGVVVERTGSTENPFQYIGQKGYYRDKNSGEYEVRRRPLADDGWLCRDLVEILSSYIYVDNKPTMLVDPSGLDPLGGVCCDCDNLVTQLRGNRDYQYDFGLITVDYGSIKPPKPSMRRTCRVNIRCEPIAACEGLPGHTYKPIKASDSTLYEYSIDICISCRYSPVDLVFYHELKHAEQFCVTPTLNLTTCTGCQNAETKAHEINCKMAFLDDPDGFKRCVECAWRLSCSKQCHDQTWVSKDDKGDDVVTWQKKVCDVSKDLGGVWAPVKAGP